MCDMSAEALIALNEEKRKELYIEWLMKRAVASATNKLVAAATAELLLCRLKGLWNLDQVTTETWESEAALRAKRFF